MCGRYQLSIREKDISIRFHVEVYEKLYRPSYNCAPSQNLAVISNSDPEILSFYRWGLIPFWAKDPKTGFRMINAKAETITEKASFKTPFKKRRCLVLSNGFFEWKKKGKEKNPYRIFLKHEKAFALAGIWDSWKDPEGKEIKSFSIITTSPNTLMKNIHDRMPVILKQKDEKKWLEEENPDELLKLLKPYDENEMEVYPVSKLVNSPLNNSQEIIEKIEVSDTSENTLF